MKLTKRLLAVLLSVAMLVGMVAVGASASDLPQLDESVPTYDEDCLTHDPENNPYTVKYGFKLYKVDTATDEYTYLPDTNTSNDTYDVEVAPGDVLRVEWWAQTNFLAYGIQAFVAYDNTFLKATKNAANGYTTFEMKSTNLAMAQAFEKVEMGVSGDGTMASPVYSQDINTIAVYSAAKATYNALKAYLPTDWKGTGGTINNWYNTSNADILNADGGMKYNFHLMGLAATDSSLPYVSYAAVYNVYQPMAAYHLTVDSAAANGSVAELFVPEESILKAGRVANGCYTWVQALDTEAVMASDFYDPSYSQIQIGASASAQKSTVTYSDGTVAEKVWDIENVTITVNDGTGAPEEPTTEETTTEPTTAPVVKDALLAAINTLPSITEDKATSASWAAYEAALAKANEVYADDAATQDDVDAAAAALTKATGEVAALGACDYKALDDAIAAYDALDKADWTPASWTASDVDAKYAAAKAVARDLVADEAGANQAKIDAAAAELDAAIKALVAVADKAALKTAIDTLPAIAEDMATSASWAAYEAALAKANEVYADANATQDDVNAAAAALTKATGEVAALGACDYKALDDAIAAYDALDKADWTPASWTASDVDAKYAAAKAVARDLVADEAGANQAKIDAAAAELDAAIKALVAVADKAELVAAIGRASALSADAYTPASWAAADLANVLAAANEVNADANATQDAVDNAVAAIEAAEAKLVVKADKDALANAIADAKALDAADYTPASWTAANLEKAIADAEAVNNNGDATDADVTAAIKALADAKALLVEVADKADLKTAIDTLPAIAEDDADPATWADYVAALNAANEVYADANATQDAVNDAETNLLAAIAGVKEKETVYCDYSDLDAAIEEFEALDEAAYTPNSYAAVKALYDAAKAIERNLEYTDENQTAIDEAYDALNNAMIRDLVKVADKAALKAAIDTVVDTANCTSASIAKYEAALADANAVYADANATQDAVNAATEALVAAQSLEKLPKIDYTDLKAAMAKFEALNAADWTDDSYAAAKAAYDVAADLLAQDLYDDEDYVNGEKVDGATDDLNNAIGALKAAVKKDALLAEINKAASVEEDLATDATWAEYANALANAQDVYDDEAATQDDVDTAAAELAAANAALETRGLVDYAALDAALALVPAEAEDAYTVASWKAYADAKAAAEAVARDLIDNKSGTNAKLVADAAAALKAAYAALKINAANITNVEWDNTDYYVPGTLTYTFTVNGGASKIQVLSPDGGTMTFDRRSSKVSIVSYNAAGEVVDYADEEPAYEEWTINLVLSAAEYQVRAKYNYTWDTEYYAFTVVYDEYDTKTAAFTASAGDTVDATEITVAKGEVITFKAVTDATAIKVQFVFADGGTSTYSKGYAVNNGDGTLTWTITRTFSRDQDINLRVKAPTGWGAEYAGNVKVTIE